MFDTRLRRLIDPSLDRAAAILSRRGVGADLITWFGFALGIGGAVALAHAANGIALALILANRVCDGLDGAVARRQGPTDLGGYLDIVCDFLFYSAVVFGFAVGRPDDALAAAFLIFSFVATGTTFLAYAVMAAKRPGRVQSPGGKAFVYLGGLTEGTETIVLFVLMCLFPAWFMVLAYGFGLMCWVTAITRIRAAIIAFSDPVRPPT